MTKKTRIRVVGILWVLSFVFLGFRLWQIQASDYAMQAFWQAGESIALEAYPRGEILARQGESLTPVRQETKLAVWSEYLGEADRLKLAQVLEIEVEELALPINFGLLPYELDSQQLSLLAQADLPGVMIVPYWNRSAGNPLASAVVGYLGKVKDLAEVQELNRRHQRTYSLEDWVGRQGLEKYYEAELQGSRATKAIRLLTDALGRNLQTKKPEIYLNLEDQQRHNLLTTLDYALQEKTEQILEQAQVRGAVVIMDKSGDLLTLASRPTFNPDPTQLAAYLSQPESFLDQTTALFSPGSVFKIVIAAAALEENLIQDQQFFECKGTEDSLIPCWKAEGHQQISFAEAFAQSCNPVFAQLAQELGAEKVIAYARQLSLDNQKIAGYPVPEQSGQDLEQIGQGYNLTNSAIGQGPVLVTPVQITALLNTIINGGIYQQPRLVMAVQSSAGSQEIRPENPQRAISSQTALALQKLLIQAVEKGAGKTAAWGAGSCGGKTGSAEVGDGTINAWFSGFLPAENPQYLVTVLIREGESGSSSAAPLFKQIGEFIEQKYLKPD